MNTLVKRISLVSMVLALFVVLLSGCTSSGQGTLVLKLTDQPAELNITRVDVTISEVRVHLSGRETNDSGNESADTAAEGWISVVEEAQTFDLVQLRDVTTLLGQTNLTSGQYTQIRLRVETATANVNGEEVDLRIPSEVIKLNRPFTIRDGQTTSLILDFDAQESISAAGGMYVMRPTIRISQE